MRRCGPDSKMVIPNMNQQLKDELLRGSRRALARAITLVESNKPEHRERAEELLSAVLPYTGNAIRVGISGVPGVGKSTFIENLGTLLCNKGSKLAVLAVDPTSKRTGGSIMGDKTRMQDLSHNPNAYIRPSPAGTTLGGVARRTRESLLLCEAAGFDLIFVETVGVGQSETAVADMVDIFTLLMLPAGGDELQGVKRGIIELADFILINKADGDLRGQALATLSDYTSAARFMRPRFDGFPSQAKSCSAETHEGLNEFWQALLERHAKLDETGLLTVLRTDQNEAWYQAEIRQQLAELLIERQADQLISQVRGGEILPSVAARNALKMKR